MRGKPRTKCAADLGRRRNVLIGALAFWSLMTGLGGLALNSWHLLLARIAVGVGEAGCVPTCQSLVSDYFPPKTRAFGLSIVSAGLMGGKVLGIGGAGLLVGIVGWEHTMVLLAIRGFVVAVVVRFIVREPPKGRYEQLASNAPRLAAWPAFRTKSYWTIAIALAFSNFVIFGGQSWSQRLHALVRTFGGSSGSRSRCAGV